MLAGIVLPLMWLQGSELVWPAASAIRQAARQRAHVETCFAPHGSEHDLQIRERRRPRQHSSVEAGQIQLGVKPLEQVAKSDAHEARGRLAR